VINNKNKHFCAIIQLEIKNILRSSDNVTNKNNDLYSTKKDGKNKKQIDSVRLLILIVGIMIVILLSIIIVLLINNQNRNSFNKSEFPNQEVGQKKDEEQDEEGLENSQTDPVSKPNEFEKDEETVSSNENKKTSTNNNNANNNKDKNTETYICPSGYTLINNNECKKVNKVKATMGFICENGGVLSGTACYFSTVDATKNTNRCPDGGEYTRIGDESIGWSCFIFADIIKNCPSGYDYGGAYGIPYQCVKRTPTPKESCTPINNYIMYFNESCHDISNHIVATESCPNGYSFSSGRCYKHKTPAPEYLCPDGYEVDYNKCRKSSYNATKGLLCDKGYSLDGEYCVKEEIIPATKK